MKKLWKAFLIVVLNSQLAFGQQMEMNTELLGIGNAISGLFNQQQSTNQTLDQQVINNYLTTDPKTGNLIPRNGATLDPFFLKCTIPKTPSAFPANACYTISKDPNVGANDAKMAATYQEIATAYIEYFERFNTPQMDPNSDEGVGCFENQKKLMEDTIQRKINALKNELEVAKANADAFKKAMQDNWAKMESEANTLYGPSAEAPKEQFKGLSCDNVITPEVFESTENGLMGIRTFFNAIPKSSDPSTSSGLTSSLKEIASTNNISTLKSKITSNINTIMSSLNENITKHGISSFLNADGSVAKDFKVGSMIARGVDQDFHEGTIDTLVSNHLRDYSTKYTEAKKYLADTKSSSSETNYIPNMDSNFFKNLKGRIQTAESTLYNKFMIDCVTGTQAGQSKGMSITDLITNARAYASTSDQTAQRAITELEKTLKLESSSSSVDSLIANISKMITANNFQGHMRLNTSVGTFTSYLDYFKTARTNCINRYNEPGSGQFYSGTNIASNETMKGRVDEIVKKLKALDNNSSTFFNGLQEKIEDTVMTCKGRELPTGSMCSDASVFNLKNSSFCMQTATNCAAKVRSCYQATETIIARKKAAIYNYAGQINSTYQQYFNYYDSIFQNAKTNINSGLGMLSAMFPGTTTQLQKLSTDAALMIARPNAAVPNFLEENDKTIQLLYKGLDDETDQSFETAMNSLIQALENQKTNITSELEIKLKDKKDQLEAQIEKWTTLKEKCETELKEYNGRADQARDAQNDANRKAQEKKAKDLSEIVGFCDSARISSKTSLLPCKLLKTDVLEAPVKILPKIRQFSQTGVLPKDLDESMVDYITYLSDLKEMCGHSNGDDHEAAEFPNNIYSYCQKYPSNNNNAIFNKLEEKLSEKIITRLCKKIESSSKRNECVDQTREMLNDKKINDENLKELADLGKDDEDTQTLRNLLDSMGKLINDTDWKNFSCKAFNHTTSKCFPEDKDDFASFAIDGDLEANAKESCDEIDDTAKENLLKDTHLVDGDFTETTTDKHKLNNSKKAEILETADAMKVLFDRHSDALNSTDSTELEDLLDGKKPSVDIDDICEKVYDAAEGKTNVGESSSSDNLNLPGSFNMGSRI